MTPAALEKLRQKETDGREAQKLFENELIQRMITAMDFEGVGLFRKAGPSDQDLNIRAHAYKYAASFMTAQLQAYIKAGKAATRELDKIEATKENINHG